MSVYDELPKKVRGIKYRYDNEALNEIIKILELCSEAINDLKMGQDMNATSTNEELEQLHKDIEKLKHWLSPAHPGGPI